MKTIKEMVVFEFKQLMRLFPTVFFSIFFPILLLIVFGIVYSNKPTPEFGGFGSVDLSTPGYVAMIIAVNGIVNLSSSISFYKENKIFKRLRATPINLTDIIIAQFVVHFLMAIISTIILLIVAFIIFDIKFYGNIVSFIFAMIISALSISSIGFLIGGISSGSKSCTAVANIVYFPMLFLSGGSFPIELMPEKMVNIGKIFPLTYSVRLLKETWLGHPISSYPINILVLIGVFILCTIISIKTFKWE
ncbi:ABC transporter, permease protein [Gottschalkia purinilytica]|uniref:Transport permease protein n=1 Tax=Gottschalkia purinilytica TaxID=1503 RepID=A0A0L0WCS2_GOTPU|nr:ABC transporter permease [Gottschalkia purinilytica]KNF09279.1 ABC transporter, permease protein [Gottschalkia purinilytica]